MGYPQYSTNSGRRRQYMDEEPRRRSYISGRQQPFHSEYASPDYTRGRDARQTTQAYSGMRNTAAAATAPVNFDPEHGTSYGDYVRTPTGERVGAASAEIDPNTGAWGRKALAPSSRPGKAAAQPKSDLPPNRRPPRALTPQGPGIINKVIRVAYALRRALTPQGPGMINGQPAMAAIAEARKAAEVVPGGGMAPYAATQAGDRPPHSDPGTAPWPPPWPRAPKAIS